MDQPDFGQKFDKGTAYNDDAFGAEAIIDANDANRVAADDGGGDADSGYGGGRGGYAG